jgi:CheY-like chemotaxis protein
MTRAAKKGRILLAEDDPRDVDLVLEALARHQLAGKVDVVNDGAAALDYLYRHNEWAQRPGEPPLVLLLDLKMPRVGGLEVLRTVRSDPRLRLIPAVMLTSSREESDLLDSYRVGANAFVVKPIAFGEFLDALADVAAYWVFFNEPPPDTVTAGEPA